MIGGEPVTQIQLPIGPEGSHGSGPVRSGLERLVLVRRFHGKLFLSGEDGRHTDRKLACC